MANTVCPDGKEKSVSPCQCITRQGLTFSSIANIKASCLGCANL
ncbi:Uncharacterised protein [Vibrio cholerae]|nr:Uncharacterised protein [Vibrio cholerae]